MRRAQLRAGRHPLAHGDEGGAAGSRRDPRRHGGALAARLRTAGRRARGGAAGRLLVAGRRTVDGGEPRRVRSAGTVTGRLIARLVELATDGLSEPDGTTAADRAAGRASRSWHSLPGARELLVALRAPRDGSDGTPLATALVTSSWRDFTLTLLATSEASVSESSASERTHPFDAIVCGEDVTDGKPAPDGFLRAAALLGVAPDECLVIEDSPTGVAAAEAAGMIVLAVPHAGHLDPAPGRAVRRDLVGLTGTGLVALHARLRSGASA